MNIELFNKVFNNIYLSKIIYSNVQLKKDDGYKLLSEWGLDVILNDNKLFKLKYSSYKYYKDIVKDTSASKLVFQDLMYRYNCQALFESRVIEYEIFVELYQDFKLILFKYYSKRRIMNHVIKSLDQRKVQYLLDQGFKFNLNKFSQVVSSVCSIQDSTVEYLEFIIASFKKNHIDYKEISRIKSENKSRGIPNTLNNINWVASSGSIDEHLNVQVEVLVCLMDRKKIEFYDTVFRYYMKSFQKSLDETKMYGRAFSKMKSCRLISFILLRDSKEMAQVYAKYYPHQRFKYSEYIKVNYGPSIKALSVLIINGTLTVSNFNFIMFNSVQEFKPILDYYNINRIEKNIGYSLEVNTIKDFESLKYLYNERKSFTPELQFNGLYLLQRACFIQDMDMVHYCIAKFRSEPISIDSSYKNTSFEIFKYFYDNYQNFTFTDVQFSVAFNNQMEYAKFIVEKFKSKDPRIQLSYRALDRVVEKNYMDIAEYLVNEIGYLGISRDVINNIIKSGDLNSINKFKNIKVTKTDETFTIYDSTYQFIIKNKRNDIINSLQDSIYKDYFKYFKI